MLPYHSLAFDISPQSFDNSYLGTATETHPLIPCMRLPFRPKRMERTLKESPKILGPDHDHSQDSLPQIYRSLTPGTRQTRFLVLEEYKEGSTPNGSLRMGDLAQQPVYQALSYVWGSRSHLRPVCIGQATVEVTVNLECALRALSSKGVGLANTLLWVDAICINQNDNIEKGHQVKMMADIYRNASEVIAWMGEPPLLRPIAFNEWWTRQWIIQEAVLAKSLVFLVGDELRSYESWSSKYRLKGKKGEEGIPCDRLHQLLVSKHRRPTWMELTFTRVAPEPSAPTLVELLVHCRGKFHTSEPLDIVYSLLGMAGDASWIEPDYTKTLRDVSKGLALWALTSPPFSLDLVVHCGLVVIDNQPQLPSWVPSWDRSLERTSLPDDWEMKSRVERRWRYDNIVKGQHNILESNPAPHPPRLENNDSVLVVKGVIVDTLVSREKIAADPEPLFKAIASATFRSLRPSYRSTKDEMRGANGCAYTGFPAPTAIGDVILRFYTSTDQPHMRNRFYNLVLRKYKDGFVIVGSITDNSWSDTFEHERIGPDGGKALDPQYCLTTVRIY